MLATSRMKSWPTSYVEAAAAELERRRRQRARGAQALADWRVRVPQLFPSYVWHPFSQPHAELWEWANAIMRDSRPAPLVAIWPRGRGKSTHAEMVVTDMGGRQARQYALYVCETQDQADKHVATIAAMLESEPVTRHYPALGQPRVGKNGSRTWNRQIVRSEHYTVEAIGLDKAIRGAKIDWVRPDLIVFDDIDARHDTPNATAKKQDTITTSILPAGADNAAVLFVQNLIHADSIAHRLSWPPGMKGAAGWLTNRIVSGPYVAVDGLRYELREEGGAWRWQITEGRSLWNGYDLDVCEDELNRVGPTSFEVESQHDVDSDSEGALLTTAILDRTRVSAAPDLFRIVVGVDPQGGAGVCGIVAVGASRVGNDTHGYTIADYSTEQGASPATWGRAVLRCYHDTRADAIAVERNFGGEMAAETIRSAELRDGDTLLLSGRQVQIIEVTASRGKEVRAQPVAAAFELGRGHHVGHYPQLQRQWVRWIPGTQPSPDRMDAEVWAYTELGIIGRHSAADSVAFA